MNLIGNGRAELQLDAEAGLCQAAGFLPSGPALRQVSHRIIQGYILCQIYGVGGGGGD